VKTPLVSWSETSGVAFSPPPDLADPGLALLQIIAGVERTKIRPLQRGDGTINSAFTPARHAGKSVFGGSAEGSAVGRVERTREAADEVVGVDLERVGVAHVGRSP
jgi:hypothetical protein